MKTTNIQKLTLTGILSAIAFVLMFFEFPIPLFPEFLKVDLSDIPAIFGAFAMGPLAGIGIEFVKNVLHFLVKSTTGGIGEMANFTCGAVLVLSSGLIYKMKREMKFAIIGIFVGIVTMAFAMSLFNYFVFIPMFYPEMPKDAVLALIKTAIFPFNLVKGVIAGVIALLAFKGLMPVINKFAFTLDEKKSLGN